MTSGVEPVSIRLYLDGVLIGERRWPTVPAIGHTFRCRVAGVVVLAKIIDVVWGGSTESAIADVSLQRLDNGTRA